MHGRNCRARYQECFYLKYSSNKYILSVCSLLGPGAQSVSKFMASSTPQRYPQCTYSSQHPCQQQSPSVQPLRPHLWLPAPTSLTQDTLLGPLNHFFYVNTIASSHSPKLCLSPSLSASPDRLIPSPHMSWAPNWSHDLLTVHENLQTVS